MICWYNRLVISHRLDAGRSLPVSVEKHIDGCESCRWFYQVSYRTGQALSSDAPGVPPVYRKILSETILRQTSHIHKASSGRSRRHFLLTQRSILAAAAIWAVIITLGFFVVLNQMNNSQELRKVEVVTIKPTVSSEVMVLTDFVSNEVYPVGAAIDALQGLIQEVGESPSQELQQISEEGSAAVNTLLACLPIDTEMLMDD